MTHKCVIISGGGTEHDGGIWHVRETPKKIVFQKMVGTMHSDPFDRLECARDGRGKHALRDWDDGSFTVYPLRNGTPWVFEPVDNRLDSPAAGAKIHGTDTNLT